MLTRFAVRLRWPFAVAAALAIAVSVLSNWFWLTVPLLPLPGERESALIVQSWHAIFVWGDLDTSTGLQLRSGKLGDRGWVGIYTSQINVNPSRAALPIWVVALLPASFSFFGFRNNRTRPAWGTCASCHHTLVGASTCPECGCPAPSS